MNQKYTDEFKQNAVRLVTEQGCTHREAAKKIGVSQSSIFRWINNETQMKSKPVSKQSILSTSERAELDKLRKENNRLKMERDTFKKAVILFANENE